jgi:hypothetical protein
VNRAFILLLVLLASCGTLFKKSDERVLARAFDEYLYESELRDVIPAGTSSADSIALAKAYVRNWISQRLIIHQAEKNLTGEQLDFSRQLENYKNSLIIYEYENALVRQKLDTLVTNDEIQSYYDANQQNFLLKDNIVQFRYVKLPLRNGSLKQFKKYLNSDDPDDRNRLADLCEKQAADFFLDNQNWLLFSDLLKLVPVKSYNQEDFLKNNRFLEYQDSLFIYLVRFDDFKIKESVSPLSFERQRIIDIILNKRKVDLLNTMQQDIFNRARSDNDFEIY